MEGGGIGERRGNRAIEAVSVEVKAAEGGEGAKLQREVCPDVVFGNGDHDDLGVGEAGDGGVGDTIPVTGGGVIFISIGEGRRRPRR